MWGPRLWSLALCVGSLAMLYSISWSDSDFYLFLQQTDSSNFLPWVLVLFSMVLVFGAWAGFFGVVTSFCVEPVDSGFFRPKDNWLGKLVDSLAYDESGFCEQSLFIGITATFAFVFLSFCSMLAFFAWEDPQRFFTGLLKILPQIGYVIGIVALVLAVVYIPLIAAVRLQPRWGVASAVFLWGGGLYWLYQNSPTLSWAGFLQGLQETLPMFGAILLVGFAVGLVVFAIKHMPFYKTVLCPRYHSSEMPTQ